MQNIPYLSHKYESMSQADGCVAGPWSHGCMSGGRNQLIKTILGLFLHGAPGYQGIPDYQGIRPLIQTCKRKSSFLSRAG